MNLHVPQSIEAEIELFVNANCANHIVSSQSNGPVNGPVQDALVGIYMLTKHWDDGTVTMVNRKIALQIYKESEIHEEAIKDLLERAQEYYPEFIRSCINPIDGSNTLEFTEEIPGSLFVSILFPSNLCYSRTIELENGASQDVKIEDGVLLKDSVHLCAKSVGGKNNSVVHVLWKRNPWLALKFMSNLQQITDRWLPTYGFSMGIADCFASCSSDVAKTLLETRAKVDEILNNPHTNKSDSQIEREIMNILNGSMATGPSLAKGSMAKGDRNALNIMRNSGAKGSLINLSQIVAAVGQQNIKGVRMPPQLSHESRCLPSFLAGDKSPDARGFVEHNYIQGLTPQEAFFHAGAGRDGVISTALKSVTGDTFIAVACDNGVSCKLKIGDWIDALLFQNKDNVQKFPEREMELLDISHLNFKIQSVDEQGNVKLCDIKNVTRHDPGKMLFEIKTQSGRSVTVTESKALLVWDELYQEFLPKDTPLVKIGDFLPVTASMIDPLLTQHEDTQYTIQNDVALDPIIEIKNIEISDYELACPKYKGRVYDLTVPETLNFALYNGLHVRDTADTGYLQKRLGRKMEDSKVCQDGTVRNANGKIISFLYGDDGMEAKKLVSVKGLSVPFFINPYILSKQLNSDAKREFRQNHHINSGGGSVNLTETPRKLYPEEINFLLDVVGEGYIQTPSSEVALSNTKEILSEIVKNVELYECKIADFIVEIKKAYDNSKAPQGYAAGLVATSSLGEPNSQMTMNSFHTTGIGGKNEGVGVARFRELINATKSGKQKNAGCTIYFNDETLVENAKSISQLEKESKTSTSPEEIKTRIKEIKQESLAHIEARKNLFEEKYVIQFLKDYQIKYLNIEGIKDRAHSLAVSPVVEGLITYEDYAESWWVTLSKDLSEKYINLPTVPCKWVINLEFNIEKLFNARIELEDIAFALEDASCCALTCVISPNIIGRIEVYVDTEMMKSHLEDKIKIGGVITNDNLDYYLVRDPTIDFIKKTLISGVQGVKKAYSREDLSTHEWVMDTDGAQFLDILTASSDIDTVRTLVNDIHEIASVLGIEAARRFLFEDISRVISHDGTYINPRHISLLVDVMTASGDLTAASRDGISRDDAGPNAKIMFEKSIDNAMIACAFGEVDLMTSLASSVMYGKVALLGPKTTEICVKNTANKQPPLKVREKSKVNKTLSLK